MTKKDKIQHLLITHLREEGHIELVLPDGIILEVGVTKEGRSGDLEKCDNYSWVIATQDDRTVSIDSYNLGLRFMKQDSRIVFEDSILDNSGHEIKVFDIV